MFNHIEVDCDCILEEEAIHQDHLLCDQSQPNKTVFRAKITTYQLTHNDMLIIMQNMVRSRRLMLDDSTVLTLDNSCPVEISSFNDPLCAQPITDNVKESKTQYKKSSPTAAIVGSVIPIVMAIVVAIFVLVLMLYWRNKLKNR